MAQKRSVLKSHQGPELKFFCLYLCLFIQVVKNSTFRL